MDADQPANKRQRKLSVLLQDYQHSVHGVGPDADISEGLGAELGNTAAEAPPAAAAAAPASSQGLQAPGQEQQGLQAAPRAQVRRSKGRSASQQQQAKGNQQHQHQQQQQQRLSHQQPGSNAAAAAAGAPAGGLIPLSQLNG